MRLLLIPAVAALSVAEDFERDVRGVLSEHCGACHNPANPKNRVDFLKAQTPAGVESRRGMWRNVATQMHNRTMPPVASKLSDGDRARVVRWIETRLRETACAGPEYAGAVTLRRLNRREYRNTVRDLLGVDLAVNEIFPEDGAGGEGFDTNAETLYVPPMLMERYMEAARIIADRALVTPPLKVSFTGNELAPAMKSKAARRPIAVGEAVTATVTVFATAEYDLRVSLERSLTKQVEMGVKVDGKDAGVLVFQRYEAPGAAVRGQALRLGPGEHSITLSTRGDAVEMFTVTLDQRAQEPASERKALHQRLIGFEVGETPAAPRRAAERFLTNLLRHAYRRPVIQAETDRLLSLYDRSAERHDPYEERLKLMLRAVLVSPQFLFRQERTPETAAVTPLGGHEIATRLAYFLWSTMPDAELAAAADGGRLNDAGELARQVDRMLDDARSRVFASTFMGQWLGTREVGGRLVPATGDIQHFYTPDVAADLREEPGVLFHYILGENAPLLDLMDGDYSLLTERLVRFYQIEDHAAHVRGPGFQRVSWPDRRRGGLLGLGSVLAMTSNPKQTSPVQRGAWVLDTLFGTPAPPPPADVPPLETGSKSRLTVRQKLEKHRADPACASCHNLMDPIGFGLENFDWMGRWRDQDNGQAVDAKGVMPSGEAFEGPIALRQELLKRKDEFMRHLTSKVLGYALGRVLQDRDQCTVQSIADRVAADGYRGRTLIREVVLSTQFRNAQAGVESGGDAAKPRRPRPRTEK